MIKNSHHKDKTLQIAIRPQSGKEALTENGVGNGNAELRVPDPMVLEQLAVSDTECAQSETSRQKITKGIMEAAQELDQKLSNEGEDTLEKAGQLVSEAELKHLEALRELESAEIIRAEADAYFEKVIDKVRRQVEQTLIIKTAAVTYQEKLLKAMEPGSSTGSGRTGQGRKLLGMMPNTSKSSLKQSEKPRKSLKNSNKRKKS